MYLEYWGLEKHAFNNVPDPEMYFSMHRSVENAVAELLFAVEEGDECLAVITGAVGVGKTMALRIVLDSMDNEKYKIAFVTNPDLSFNQLLSEIIGQLEGEECQERRKDKLFERFNKILFETNDQGKKVIIFIDEGNVIKPHNLESLRLMTNMQDDKQNLFTLVLAGQPELARRLEDPRRANLFQRIGVYSKMSGIDSRETMKDYIEHRLERAGCKKQVFSEDAYDALWEHSEEGIPRLVNKICKLSLKAGETNGVGEVNAEIVHAVAERFARKVKKKVKKAAVSEPKVREVSQDIHKKVWSGSNDKIVTNSDVPFENVEIEASKLATQQLQTNNGIKDPYEEWVVARRKILDRLKDGKPVSGPEAAQPKEESASLQPRD